MLFGDHQGIGSDMGFGYYNGFGRVMFGELGGFVVQFVVLSGETYLLFVIMRNLLRKMYKIIINYCILLLFVI